jgi:hypothetical protein
MKSMVRSSGIQMIRETANLLIAAGKGKWIKPEETFVYVKGKRQMKMFFLQLQPATQNGSSAYSSEAGASSGDRENLALAKFEVDSLGESQ